jgi:sugar phosphate isomerase/epimerase
MKQMQRRTALQLLAAAPWVLSGVRAADDAVTAARTNMGLVIHSFWIRREKPLEPAYPPISDPIEFIAAAAKFGAAGVQTGIGVRDAGYLARLRDALERHQMYLEGTASLPKDADGVARFDEELRVAKEAGVQVVRTVCMSGRRYETYDAAEQFRQFADQSWKSLQLAEPVARRHGIRLAVENHKDWRIDEMLGWLKRLSSEHVGVCLDTGNSIALLEDPHDVVEAYAPWTFTTHFKDMGVAEYDDGFLLSEVPLGQGFLDLSRVIATLRKAHPDVRLNLEMITRDPLRVPCLTKKYWATLGSVPGADLAGALARVRHHKSPVPLPTVTPLDHPRQLEAEAANIVASLDYAREKLKV